MAVFDDIREIISSKLGVAAENIKPETSFTDDLNADSLDLADLVMAIEDKYGVELGEASAEQFKTVGDVVKVIEEKQAEA
jgi:acyl carrier protein